MKHCDIWPACSNHHVYRQKNVFAGLASTLVGAWTSSRCSLLGVHGWSWTRLVV